MSIRARGIARRAASLLSSPIIAEGALGALAATHPMSVHTARCVIEDHVLGPHSLDGSRCRRRARAIHLITNAAVEMLRSST